MPTKEKIDRLYVLINEGMGLTLAARAAGINNRQMTIFRRTKEFEAIYNYYMKRKQSGQLPARI